MSILPEIPIRSQADDAHILHQNNQKKDSNPKLPRIGIKSEGSGGLSPAFGFENSRRNSFVSKSIPEDLADSSLRIASRHTDRLQNDPWLSSGPRESTLDIDKNSRLSTGNSTAKRRMSILETTMMDGSDSQRVISSKDHSIERILDANITNLLSIFNVIASKEESVYGSNQELPLKRFIQSIRTLENTTLPSSRGKTPSGLGSNLNNHSSTAIPNLEDLYQLLSDSFEEMKNQTSDELYSRQIKKIMSERQQHASPLTKIKNEIQFAQSKAASEERQKTADALHGFNDKFKNTVLPQFKVLLKMDDIEFSKFGLLLNPENEKDEEEDLPLDQKIKDLLAKIKCFVINRTKSSVYDTQSSSWFVDQNIKMIFIERPGVLEVDAERIKAPKGALEPPKHGRIKRNLHYPPDAQKIIYRMNTRINYLKNPRFVLPPIEEERIEEEQKMLENFDSKNSSSDSAISIPNANAFGIIADPAIVLFTDYEPQYTYTQILTIRNKTKNSHRFRLSPLPPYTYSSHFSYELIKSPIQYDGLVAPGMYSQYRITFRPDTLSNVTFVLLVSTESGYSFTVPLCARRDSPILTLPDTLHCGPCRAGFISFRKWEFQNLGGPGKFILLQDSDDRDPWTVIKNIKTPAENVFRQGPFEIYPAYFSVGQDATATLTIKYSANEVDANGQECDPRGTLERVDEILIRIGCDNGQILQLPVLGIAQMSRLTITRAQCDDGTVLRQKDIAKVDEFDMFINFGIQNPHAVSMYLIAIKNKTQIKLPFQWVVYDNPGNKRAITDKKQNESFQIIPSKGWIGPDAEMTFELNFNPEFIKEFDVLAKMLLLKDAQKVKVIGKESDESEDEVAINLRLLGKGVPYSVEVNPPVLDIPEVIYSTASYSTQIRLYNSSVSKIAFEWTVENVENAVMEVNMSQTSGTIPPQSYITIDLNLLGKFPRNVNGALVCSTAHGLGPKIRVPLIASVQLRPNSLEFDTELIDFGLIHLGSSQSGQVTLTNRSPYVIAWKTKIHSRNYMQKDANCYMSCEPNRGFLNPSESQLLSLNYVPVWYQSFRALLECQLLGIWTILPDPLHFPSGDPVSAAAIQLKAEVQTPIVEIVNPKNHVTSFTGVQFNWIVTLKNTTMLKSRFKWLPNNNPMIQAQFFPEEGELQGKHESDHIIRITCKSLGYFPNIDFYCQIDHMVEDKGLVCAQMVLNVRPIDISLSVHGNKSKSKASPLVFTTRQIPDETINLPHVSSASDSLLFNFGADCPVFATRLRTLVIRNMTSATAPFKILLEKYAAKISDGKRIELETDTIEVKRTAENHDLLLLPTPRTKLGFNSKIGQSYINNINKVRNMIQQMHDLLKDGRGAAFNPTPREGSIGPWQEIKIEIISYNNLVGVYDDVLICQIGDTIKEAMKVKLSVVGTAVKFSGAQLVSNKKNLDGWIDRVNFGSRIVNPKWLGGDGVRVGRGPDETNVPEAFSKMINIENQSPRPVALTWKTFIHFCSPHDQVGAHECLDPKNVQEESKKLNENDLGVIEVLPKSVTIPPFKTIPLKILFRSAIVGAYDAYVFAEPAYIEQSGNHRYAPVQSNSKLYPKSLARLHIQAKVTEPKLSLEEGETIRIKKSLKSALKNKDVKNDGNTRNINVFLKNKSDAICSFYLDTTPSQIFTFRTSTSKMKHPSPTNDNPNSPRKTPSRSTPMYELKPTEQMLVAITYYETLELTEARPSTNPLESMAPDNLMATNAVRESFSAADPVQGIEAGYLKITFSNGMIQRFPIIVETSIRLS